MAFRLPTMLAFNPTITAMVSGVGRRSETQPRHTVRNAAGDDPDKNHLVLLISSMGQSAGKTVMTSAASTNSVATWKPPPKACLGRLMGLYGHEENGVAVGHDALWKGLAGKPPTQVISKFSLAFRWEPTTVGTVPARIKLCRASPSLPNTNLSSRLDSHSQGGWKVCSATKSAAGPVEQECVS